MDISAGNFKWTYSNKSNFVVLHNNVFSLYSIISNKQGLRNQDIELSDSLGSVCKLYSYPSDTETNHKKYSNFIVHPSQEFDILSSYQQKLYYIKLNNPDSREQVLDLNSPGRQTSSSKRINHLDWNHRAPDRVALSIEKSRTAKGILVADINEKTQIEQLGCEGDGVQCIRWSPHSATILAAGISKKRIELFDILYPKNPLFKINDIMEYEGVCFFLKYVMKNYKKKPL